MALERGGRRAALKTFDNGPQGHQAIIRHLRRPGRSVRVCLESTGEYGLDLALAPTAPARRMDCRRCIRFTRLRQFIN